MLNFWFPPTFTPHWSIHAFPTSVHGNSIIAAIRPLIILFFSHIWSKSARISYFLYFQSIYTIWSLLVMSSLPPWCQSPSSGYCKARNRFLCFYSCIPALRAIPLKHNSNHVIPLLNLPLLRIKPEVLTMATTCFLTILSAWNALFSDHRFLISSSSSFSSRHCPIWYCKLSPCPSLLFPLTFLVIFFQRTYLSNLLCD